MKLLPIILLILTVFFIDYNHKRTTLKDTHLKIEQLQIQINEEKAINEQGRKERIEYTRELKTLRTDVNKVISSNRTTLQEIADERKNTNTNNLSDDVTRLLKEYNNN